MSRETEPKAGQPCQSCYLLAPFSPATPPRHPPAAKPEVYSILFHHLWAAVGGWRPLEQSTLFISANFCCAASCLCFSFAVFQFVFLGCSLPPAPAPHTLLLSSLRPLVFGSARDFFGAHQKAASDGGHRLPESQIRDNHRPPSAPDALADADAVADAVPVHTADDNINCCSWPCPL